MENIDFSPLKSILKDKTSKDKNAKDSKELLDIFNIAQNNLAEKAKSLSQEEIAMLIMSLENWTKRREFTKCKYNFRIGDIFYADLGNTYKPEYAYPHPVLILEKIGFYLLVVPTSTSEDNIKEAYHPIDNPKGNPFMRRVYGSETSKSDGFERTSALLLSNIKTISKGRLISSKGRIVDNSLLDEVKQTVFSFLFPRHKIQISKLNSKILDLENEINNFSKIGNNS
jgi:mRNA-degrading endonuclease toxin of MazEF toxin-antitoxin module